MADGHRGRGTRHAWSAYALTLPLVAFALAPFLYMVGTALTGASEDARSRVVDRLVAVVTAMPVGRFVLTSTVLSLAVAAGQVLTSATAAYALARLRFAGRDRLWLAYLSALVVPAIVLVIPRFLIIDALGWVDRYRGLISTEVVSVAGILILRQFFRALPRDLEDAARLEGADEWTVFWRVIVPASRPALATVAVFAFADQWKSFLWPLVVTRSEAMRPVEVGIANLRGLYGVSPADQMVIATLAVLPVMLAYVLAHKYFVRGVEA